MLKTIKNSYFVTQYRELFFGKDEKSHGRRCMLSFNVLSSIIANISTGAFYSAFLLLYGINLTNIGIIIMIPYVTAPFSLLSPIILSHFKKRRFLLAGARFLYYFLSIIGLTVIPSVVSGATARIICFAVILFIANSVNNIFFPGYTVWHWNFLPEKVRAAYFSQNAFITSLVGNTLVLLLSVAADAVSGSQYESAIIIAVRFLAFVFAILECIVLMLPEEYEYKTSHRTKLSDVFKIPVKNKLFLGCVLLYLGYTLYFQLSNSVLNAFLLSEVGVSYTMIYGMNAVYTLFFIFFSKFWQRQIMQKGWISVFSFTTLLYGFTYLLFMFIMPQNQIVLYPLSRILQHAIGVGLNVTAANIYMMHLPDKDRESYIAFYQLTNNFTLFIAMFIGTGAVAVIGDEWFNVLGLNFHAVSVLALLQAIICFIVFFAGKRFAVTEKRLLANAESKNPE